MVQVNGRATAKTGELFARPSDHATAIPLVHRTKEVNPDAARSRRAHRDGWVFKPVAREKLHVRKFRSQTTGPNPFSLAQTTYVPILRLFEL